MNKFLILLAGVAIAGIAAAAPDAHQVGAGAAAPRTYHYWLHPKQGMVKMDRVTHAMIPPGRYAQATTTSR